MKMRHSAFLFKITFLKNIYSYTSLLRRFSIQKKYIIKIKQTFKINYVGWTFIL